LRVKEITRKRSRGKKVDLRNEGRVASAEVSMMPWRKRRHEGEDVRVGRCRVEQKNAHADVDCIIDVGLRSW